MDNLEKLATLGTQDTARKQTKHKTQHRKIKKDEQHGCILYTHYGWCKYR